jgi:putative flippase GtrA
LPFCWCHRRRCGDDSSAAAIIPPHRRGAVISVAQLGARATAKAAKATGNPRVRYLIVGAGTNVLYFGLFWLGWHLLQGTAPYLAVTAAANFATALIVYPLYRDFVFGSATAGWIRGFAKFYTVYLMGLACSLLGMPLLIELLGFPVLLAQALLIAIVPVVSYLLHHFWTFRDISHT